jgi:cyclic pyranopterin phosphate synthase
MRDNFGRTIDYLRISLTDRCNMRCIYCMPNGVQNKLDHKDMLSYEQIMNVVDSFYELGLKKIRLTGGEPLARKGVPQFVKMVKSKYTDMEITMTTNGTMLLENLDDLYNGGLDRVNVSIDSLKNDTFKAITGFNKFVDIFTIINNLKEKNMVPIKINVVLMKGINHNEVLDFINLTKDKDIVVRFIELMPIGNNMEFFKKAYISNNEIIDSINDLVKVKSHPSEPAQYYKYKDYEGLVGFINPVSCSFCTGCNRLRLTSDGKILPCLHDSLNYDIKEYLNDKEALKKLIEKSIINKPQSHKIIETNFVPIKRNMNKIGG